MRIQEHWQALLPGLRAAGMDQAELFLKRGRSRRYERRAGSHRHQMSRESGWAVRAGCAGGSIASVGSGVPEVPRDWPSAVGRPIDLPRAATVPTWRAATDIETPLVSEGGVVALADSIERYLRREVEAARVLVAVLEDGASEAAIVNSRGVEAAWSSRAASLYLEVAIPGRIGISCHLAERHVGRFRPPAVARRLADRLLVRRDGRPLEAGPTGSVLLDPMVGVRLLAALTPYLVGPSAPARLPRLIRGAETLGSERVTLIDNGRLRGGILDAPVDGEGMPTAERILVERGRFVQPLLSFPQAQGGPYPGVGCSRRAGWRDWPQVAPSHFYLASPREVSVPDLLAAVDHGYYLLDVVGRGWFDTESDRFALPVCGFRLRAGRADGALARSLLHGRLGDWLRGLEAAGSDLSFVPALGMLGMPTCLVSGLELTPE